MLSVEDLSVSYGRFRAVQGISFGIGAGEILAVVGANGAGKTSTVGAICGLVRPSAGRVMFEGARIEGQPYHRLCGIALSPEGRQLAPTLTVAETLRLGAGRLDRRSFARRRQEVLARLPVLAGIEHQRAGTLSGGQAQMLALGRALVAGPKLLLLDEPSLGLSPAATRDIFRLIASLRAEGLAILLVEQNVIQSLAIADRAIVMGSGRILAEGSARALREDRSLSDLILKRNR